MKTVTFITLTFLGFNVYTAQNYGAISQKLDQLTKQRNINNTQINESLAGKKFVSVSESNDNTTKKVIQFDENNKIIVMEIKEEGANKNFKVYTGDMVKSNNRISVRADKLDGKTVDVPYTLNLVVQQRNGLIYLVDLSNNNQWLPTIR